MARIKLADDLTKMKTSQLLEAFSDYKDVFRHIEIENTSIEELSKMKTKMQMIEDEIDRRIPMEHQCSCSGNSKVGCVDIVDDEDPLGDNEWDYE